MIDSVKKPRSSVMMIVQPDADAAGAHRPGGGVRDLRPHFLSANNFSAIGLTISVIGIVCIGQSFALLTGDFDLSVGSVAAFCGIVVAPAKTYGMYPLMLFAGSRWAR